MSPGHAAADEDVGYAVTERPISPNSTYLSHCKKQEMPGRIPGVTELLAQTGQRVILQLPGLITKLLTELNTLSNFSSFVCFLSHVVWENVISSGKPFVSPEFV